MIHTNDSELLALLLDELFKKESVPSDYLCDTLTSYGDFSIVISVIEDLISNTFSIEKKKEIFSLLLLATESVGLQEGELSQQTMTDFVKFIAMFGYVFKDREKYELMERVLLKIFRMMANDQMEELFLVISSKFFNSEIVFAVLSKLRKVDLNLIIKKLMPSLFGSKINIPSLEALILYLDYHSFDKLSENEQNKFNDLKIPKLLLQLLGGEDYEKIYALLIIKKTFCFNIPVELCNLFTIPFEKIFDILHLGHTSEKIKFAMLDMFCEMPLDYPMMRVDGQINIILPNLLDCIEIISDEYTFKLIDFISKRKDGIFSITETFYKLFFNEKTYSAGLRLASYFNLFERNNELFSAAFLEQKSTYILLIMMKSLKFTIDNKLMTEKTFKEYLHNLLYLMMNLIEDDKQNEIIYKSIPLLIINFWDNLSEIITTELIEALPKITSFSVLCKLSEAIQQLNKEEMKYLTFDENSYVKLVCHLLLYLKFDYFKCLQILSIFSKINDFSAKNCIEYINIAVQKESLPALTTLVYSLLNTSPYYIVMKLALPNTSDNEIDDLFTLIVKENAFSFELFLEFLKVLYVCSFSKFLNIINDEAYGQKFIKKTLNRKRNKMIEDSIRAVLLVLPSSVIGRELNPEEQNMIYSVIFNTIPSNKKDIFMKEILELEPIIPLLRDANPTEEQYLLLLSIFINYTPIILNNINIQNDIIHNILVYFICSKYFVDFNESICYEISDFIIKSYKSNEMIAYILTSIQEYYSQEENSYKFIKMTEIFTEVTRRYKVNGNFEELSSFILHLLPFTLSNDCKIRRSSFNSLSYIFNLPLQKIEDNLSYEEIIQDAYSFYSKIVKCISLQYVHEIFLLIMESKNYSYSTAIFTRAVFENKECLTSMTTSNEISDLYDNYSEMNSFYASNFDAGILTYFKKYPREFLSLLLLIEPKHTFLQLLSSKDVRNIFIEELLYYFNTSTQFEETVPYYYLFNYIISTEITNSLSQKTISSVTTGLLMWIATFFADQESKVNISSISVMSDVLSNMLQKTPIKTSFNLENIVKDYFLIIIFFQEIIQYFLSLDFSTIISIIDISSIMIESENVSFITIVGIFYIVMLSILTEYSNTLVKENVEKLSRFVGECFIKVNDNNSIRILSMGLDQTLLKEKQIEIFTKQEYLDIYNLIINSLISESELYFSETTSLLLKIIDYIDKDDLDIPSFYKALIRIFDTLQFSVSYAKLLKVYLSIHTDYKDFVNNEKLSFKGFFELLPENENIIFDILEIICKTKNIFEFINENMRKDQLLDIAITYIKYTKEIKTMRTMELFNNFAKELINVNDKNAFAFKFALSLLIMPICNDNKSELQQKAIETMKFLIK